MAQAILIPITAIPQSGSIAYTSPCEKFDIASANIQAVRDVTYVPGGNTVPYGAHAVINVKFVKANHFESTDIYVNETKAAILALTNA